MIFRDSQPVLDSSTYGYLSNAVLNFEELFDLDLVSADDSVLRNVGGRLRPNMRTSRLAICTCNRARDIIGGGSRATLIRAPRICKRMIVRALRGPPIEALLVGNLATARLRCPRLQRLVYLL